MFPFILRDYAVFVATETSKKNLGWLLSWEGTVALEPGRKHCTLNPCSIRKMTFIKYYFVPLWKTYQIAKKENLPNPWPDLI